LDHGTQFAAAAACASLRAVSAVAIFLIVYSHAASQWSWPAALSLALGAWLLAIFLLISVPLVASISMTLTLGTLGLGYFLLPQSRLDRVPIRGMALTEIARRMLAGVALTLIVTTIAGFVGPVWSGSLTLFPILGTTLAVGSHRYDGPDHTVVLLRGMFLGLLSLTSFLFAFTMLVTKTGLAGTLLAGVSLAVIMQFVIAHVPANRPLPE
jgi:hypothetical protein